MSFKAIKWAMSQNLQTSPKMVLVALANNLNEKSKKCFPSHETLAFDSGMDKRSVIRQLEKLEKLGLITVLRSHKKVNNYTLNLDVLISSKDSCVTDCHSSSDTVSLNRVTDCHSNLEIEPRNNLFSTTTRVEEKKSKNEILDFEPEATDGLNNQAKAFYERFTNPKQPSINPNAVELTAEQKECFDWVMNCITSKDARWWKKRVTGRAKFIELYEKPESTLKHQYQCYLEEQAYLQQAQKNPLEGNQAGSSTTTDKVISYENYITTRRTATRNPSLAEQAADATRRLIERQERELREQGYDPATFFTL